MAKVSEDALIGEMKGGRGKMILGDRRRRDRVVIRDLPSRGGCA